MQQIFHQCNDRILFFKFTYSTAWKLVISQQRATYNMILVQQYLYHPILPGNGTLLPIEIVLKCQSLFLAFTFAPRTLRTSSQLNAARQAPGMTSPFCSSASINLLSRSGWFSRMKLWSTTHAITICFTLMTFWGSAVWRQRNRLAMMPKAFSTTLRPREMR